MRCCATREYQFVTRIEFAWLFGRGWIRALFAKKYICIYSQTFVYQRAGRAISLIAMQLSSLKISLCDRQDSRIRRDTNRSSESTKDDTYTHTYAHPHAHTYTRTHASTHVVQRYREKYDISSRSNQPMEKH